MKFLLYSLSFFLLACVADYKLLNATNANDNCYQLINNYQPGTAWYNTRVDVIGKHISGLLLIKKMDSLSYRVVFTNEAGITYFDFEFGSNGSFSKKKVIAQLDKKPVIQTLRKDFELLLGIPFKNQKGNYKTLNDEYYYGVSQKNETAYFITKNDCASLLRLELRSKRKRKVTVTLYGDDSNDPDSLLVKHYTFDMTISLKKISQ